MTFGSIFLALLGDQLSPLHRPSQFDQLYVRFSDWILPRFNAGTRSHALLAWAAAALIPATLIGLTGSLLTGVSHWLGLAWSSIVLYQCLGFRQIASQAGMVRNALQSDDSPRARTLLAEMELADVASVSNPELSRAAIAHVLRLGLSRSFGVLFWFMLFGPFGAVGYTLTVPLARRWRGDTDFSAMIDQVMHLLNWLPSRLLAFTFAIVGNFEEAMLTWRGRDSETKATDSEIVLAAGFGALGLDENATPDPDYVSGAAALLNRAALVWMALLGLLWLGGI
jgi:adenosylcobinamide-phosphate synthase